MSLEGISRSKTSDLEHGASVEVAQAYGWQLVVDGQVGGLGGGDQHVGADGPGAAHRDQRLRPAVAVGEVRRLGQPGVCGEAEPACVACDATPSRRPLRRAAANPARK